MVSVLTNQSAMTALRTLQGVNNGLGRAGDQISTGRKINSARDSAASWSVSTDMRIDASAHRILVQGYADAQTHLGVARSVSESLVSTLEKAKNLYYQLMSGDPGSEDKDGVAENLRALFDQMSTMIDKAEVGGRTLFDGSSYTVLTGTDGSAQTIGGVVVDDSTMGLDLMRGKLNAVMAANGHDHEGLDVFAGNGIDSAVSSVTASAPPTSGADHVRMLLQGYWWGGGALGTAATITYSFHNAASAYNYPVDPPSDPNPFPHPEDTAFVLSASFQQSIRDALAAWAAVANITFVEVVDDGTTAGELRFGGSDHPGTAYALGGNTASLGDVWFGSTYFGAGKTHEQNTDPGTYAYHTMLHEIGHALGLKHPHEKNMYGQNNYAGSTYDDMQYSVMSYNDYAGQPKGPYLHFPGEFAQTPMVSDIAAMQYLYGAPTTNAGDTTYTFTGAQIFEAVWDSGGNDTIDWSNQASAAYIDLNDGNYSRLGSPHAWNGGSNPYTFGIAVGTTIENATGGSANDSLIGNEVANILNGGGGNDAIKGGGGDDFIDGGAGDNVAVYTGNRSSYSWTDDGAGTYTVTGTEGTDTLVNVRYLRFADQTIDLTTGSSVDPSTITAGQSGSLTAFDTPPTPALNWGDFDASLSLGGVIDEAARRAREAAAYYGTHQQSLNFYARFSEAMTDKLTIGVGAIVDADMPEASARWEALVVQRDLASQGMAIANGAPRILLQLFG